MGGILLYVIGIIFHWLYCQVSLFYRNIPLPKCSDPSSQSTFLLLLLPLPLSLVHQCWKWNAQWNAHWLQMITWNLERGAGSEAERSLFEEAPPPHPTSSLPPELLAFLLIYGHTKVTCFQKRNVKTTESSIQLVQEAKNMSNCLVQLWDYNYKYNKIRIEKVFPSR